jgi:hypothetical protein
VAFGRFSFLIAILRFAILDVSPDNYRDQI